MYESFHEGTSFELSPESFQNRHDTDTCPLPPVGIVRSEAQDTPEGDFSRLPIVASENRVGQYYPDATAAEANSEPQKPVPEGATPEASQPIAESEGPDAPPVESGTDTPSTPPPGKPPVPSPENGDNEPFILGRLERFAAEQPTPTEQAAVAETHSAILRETLAKHGDYIDRFPAEEGGYLELEYSSPEGQARVIIIPGVDEASPDTIRTDYYNKENAGWDHHQYLPRVGGTIIRDDHDLGAVMEGLPEFGEVPLRLAVELTKERFEAGKKDRDQEVQLGLTSDVGPEQIAYVRGLVEKCEPRPIDYSELEAQVVQRLESPLSIDLDDIVRAAEEFGQSVHSFVAAGTTPAEQLREEEYEDPNYGAKMSIVARVLSDGTSVQVGHISRAGAELNDRIVDFFQRMNIPPAVWSDWEVHRTIEFTSTELQMMVTRTISIITGGNATIGGEVIDTQTDASTCDVVEARIMRNFLRKPLFIKPGRDEA